MNPAKIGIRTFPRLIHSKSRPEYSKKPPTGCAFAPLVKGSKTAFSHPLDDEKDYITFLQKELPIECCEAMPETMSFKNRTSAMVKYNLPGFYTCWTFLPELFFQFTAPPELQTPENFWKCKILRACVDLKFSYTAVLDDIVDESDVRLHKPTWKHACPEGMHSALYDCLHLKDFPYYLILKHFDGTPKCEKLLKTLMLADRKQTIGSHIDLISQQKAGNMELEVAKTINRYKTGSYIAMQAPLGMIHAGILDDELINSIVDIFTICGSMVQDWDDFTDYYCTSEQTGEPPSDLKNAGTTWASATAFQHFTAEQRAIFKECIGSDDPEKIETVKKLYDSVDLVRLYVESMKKNTRVCLTLIEELDHPECQIACISWLDWFVGDIFRR
ncbi:Farnesyl diphosphate synthase [Nesidiocoris tenuis]|uniref:Farnesyl diphosphate synthase n=1 Tax=Nesidiocoris tenuis TaxID=355587 RepID=A0ABN7AW63_9HEMI|nr:Farnesyl diphosphate synthase [Nesidiocoris tenuis]